MEKEWSQHHGITQPNFGMLNKVQLYKPLQVSVFIIFGTICTRSCDYFFEPNIILHCGALEHAKQEHHKREDLLFFRVYFKKNLELHI
jgi:hypothetical protein